MWDKLIIAAVVAAIAGWFGYQEGVESGQRDLHDCQQARKDDRLAWQAMDAKRAQDNAVAIARLQRERDAAQAAGREIERQLSDQRLRATQRFRDYDKKLADALAQGDDCVVSPDVIRLLDAAARGS